MTNSQLDSHGRFFYRGAGVSIGIRRAYMHTFPAGFPETTKRMPLSGRRFFALHRTTRDKRSNVAVIIVESFLLVDLSLSSDRQLAARFVTEE